MRSDLFIAETMRRRIGAELDAIERDRDVRILLAIESGSRAWRFPSQEVITTSDSSMPVACTSTFRLSRLATS
jgi:hypothetical protein